MQTVVLAGPGLRVELIPEIGGKVISLRSGRTGREYIWRDPIREFRPAFLGADFGDFDISGIDDCFPTVDACLVAGRPVADHGEVWSRPWECAAGADHADLAIAGTADQYHLKKRLELGRQPARVTFTYHLRNTGTSDLPYLWVGHPLFAVEPGSRVLIDGRPSARTTFSLGRRLRVRAGEVWRWPEAPTELGTAVDVSVVGDASLAGNDKVWVAARTCILQHPGESEYLQVQLGPDLPWLGWCINHAGWPEKDPGFWLALEPATSRNDALDRAIDHGDVRVVSPGEEHSWWWSIVLHSGDRIITPPPE